MKQIAIALLVAVAACGSTEPAIDPLPGTYGLVTFNGRTLPTQIRPSLGACGAMIVAASITSFGGGLVRFSESDNSPCSAGNPITVYPSDGTVTVTGSSVVLVIASPSKTFTGSLAGNTLTLATPTGVAGEPADVYVFTKQ